MKNLAKFIWSVLFNRRVGYVLKHSQAQPPTKGTSLSAGFDLYAASLYATSAYLEIDTGVVFEIPKGWCGVVVSRSSISNTPYYLANGVGVIDSDYSGTIRVRFRREKSLLGTPGLNEYSKGDRVAQIIFIPTFFVSLLQLDSVQHTERGQGGFGSTGK